MTIAPLGLTIPKFWKSAPLKLTTVHLQRGSAPAYDDEGSARAVGQAANRGPWIDWSRTRLANFTDSRSGSVRGHLIPGDSLINSTGTGTLGRIGQFLGGPDTIRCVADGHLTVARADPSLLDYRFMYYWLSARFFYDLIYSTMVIGSTNQIELDRERLASAPIAIPPLDEQRQISAFLDDSLAVMAQTTQSTESIKRLLKERLGVQIETSIARSTPKWMKLKYAVSAPLAYGANAAAEFSNPTWPRYIRITDIGANGQLRYDVFSSLPPEIASPYLLRDRDVLLARSGATAGKSFIYKESDGPACFAGYLIRARFPEESRSAEIFSYYTLTRSYWSQIESESVQATIQNISAERYSSLAIPVVPSDKADAVLDAIMTCQQLYREVVDRIDRQGNLFEERRQALITAAVTGQIDVTTARGVDV